jgi:hypothetical protein
MEVSRPKVMKREIWYIIWQTVIYAGHVVLFGVIQLLWVKRLASSGRQGMHTELCGNLTW